MKKLLILLVALTLLLSGCGEPAPQNNQNNNQQNQLPAGSTENNTATETNGELENVIDSFLDMASLSPEYKASYTMSTSAGGESTSFDYTMYMKQERKRFDLSSGEMSYKTWMLPEKTVMCMRGSAEQEEFCTEMAQEDAESQAGINMEPVDWESIQEARESYAVENLAPQTIAGQTGECFKLTSEMSGLEAQTTYCLTSDGIILLTNVTTSDGFEQDLRATSVERTVNDADLEAPEASGDLSDLMGGMNTEDFE